MFLSGPDFSKTVGQTSLTKENLKFLSSEATSAQVKECFGSEIYLDLLPCLRAGESSIMVILTKKVDMELDELTDNDWTTGTYQDILAKYNASDIKDFPPAHAVDILSIATQSDPIPMKDVSNEFMEEREGVYLGESPFARTLGDEKFKLNIDGKKEIRVSR